MRYYFDLTNGHGLVQDNTGQVFEDFKSVEREVGRILTDVARDELPDIEHGQVKVDVRDEQGDAVYEGTVKFEKRWLTATN